MALAFETQPIPSDMRDSQIGRQSAVHRDNLAFYQAESVVLPVLIAFVK